jgi:hypothetical protein
MKKKASTHRGVGVPAVPKNLGAAIDALKKLRDARKAAEAAFGARKAIEKAFEDQIFARFEKSELEGARGKLAQATIVRTEVVTIDDYEAFAAFVIRKKLPELFQRRASREAVRNLWEKGVTIPGVGKFINVRLSLTSVKAAKKEGAK